LEINGGSGVHHRLTVVAMNNNEMAAKIVFNSIVAG
jgi:hypothetical protein